MSQQVEIFTDGACSGNPGPGGYAAIIKIKGQPPIKITGYKPNTTNNRMELTAVIEALKQVKIPSMIIIFSDSRYVINSMNGGWVKKANFDLWRELETSGLIAYHSINWIWIPGDSTQIDHRECDALAKAAASGQMADALSMIRAKDNDIGKADEQNTITQAKAELCIEEIKSVLAKWGFVSENEILIKSVE